MTLIIIAGGIDLSVGAILAMGGLLGSMAMEKGQPILVGVIVGILAGAFWGFVNGASDDQAANQSIHRHAGHAGHRPRFDADHFERPARSSDSTRILVSR